MKPYASPTCANFHSMNFGTNILMNWFPTARRPPATFVPRATLARIGDTPAAFRTTSRHCLNASWDSSLRCSMRAIS